MESLLLTTETCEELVTDDESEILPEDTALVDKLARACPSLHHAQIEFRLDEMDRNADSSFAIPEVLSYRIHRLGSENSVKCSPGRQLHGTVLQFLEDDSP